MERGQKSQRSWWPWVATLVVAVPCCCSPCVSMQWKLSEGREFCQGIAVGEPLDALLSRADAAGFVPGREARKGEPGTQYLRRPLAPFCEFMCFVEHDGARVTKRAQGVMGGLCT